MKQLTKDMSRGYVEHNDKKIMMYRNEAISERFEELGIPVVDCKNTVEATTHIKELFKDYQEKYPQAFQQNDWCAKWDRTKFDLFEQWRKDHNLDFAGYQGSDGERYHSDKLLCSWLPVRIGSEFICLWSYRDNQRARCPYGKEDNALPIFGDLQGRITKEKTIYETVKIRSTDGLEFRENKIGDKNIEEIKQ